MRKICKNCLFKFECVNYLYTKQDEWVCNNFQINSNGFEQLQLDLFNDYSYDDDKFNENNS